MMQVGSKVNGPKSVHRNGTITEIDGAVALVDWGWGERYEKLTDLTPAAPATRTRRVPRCDECGRPVPGAIAIPAYCSNC